MLCHPACIAGACLHRPRVLRLRKNSGISTAGAGALSLILGGADLQQHLVSLLTQVRCCHNLMSGPCLAMLVSKQLPYIQTVISMTAQVIQGPVTKPLRWLPVP